MLINLLRRRWAARQPEPAPDEALELARSALAAIANFSYPGIPQTGLGTCADWLLAHGHGRHYVELFFEKGEWESMAALRYEVAQVVDQKITALMRKR